MTRTYAVLEVSRATYDEIRALLDGTDEVGQPGEPIDMSGLAIAPNAELSATQAHLDHLVEVIQNNRRGMATELRKALLWEEPPNDYLPGERR